MKVLFVCNGNVARSQEAEAFYNLITNNGSNSSSAGINVKIGKPIDPLVIEVMEEVGIDLSKAKRKFISKDMVAKADLIVSFKPYDQLPDYVSETSKIRYWEVADPQHQPVGFHRKVRDEIYAKVTSLVNDLIS